MWKKFPMFSSKLGEFFLVSILINYSLLSFKLLFWEKSHTKLIINVKLIQS